MPPAKKISRRRRSKKQRAMNSAVERELRHSLNSPIGGHVVHVALNSSKHLSGVSQVERLQARHNAKSEFFIPGLRVEQLIGDTDTPDLTNSETCILYHLTGYIVNKVIKHSNICDGCSSSIKQNDDTLEGEHSTLLILKEFKPGVLCQPSHE
ncbi:hypothetical protein AMECASPLE_016345, partial [Ameca splendens]